ncbi:MAG: hypothetical protein IPN85_04885 [Flavobacteriales bacterium]|nr:hypothetical protein [Flavobacteriales bacterium]MBK9287628.1 hypothetical protein [Flavobacteriales bacterium]MBL0037208.1 hypothetical protein [Flavobacteriales bacterium]
MKDLRTIIAQAAFVAAVCSMPLSADAQCRSYAKNKWVPELSPYKFNESFNAAQLAPGEDAEVSLTFYSGQEYRILVRSHPILGEVNWKLVDAGNKIIFESLADDPKHVFDFKVANTQQLKVQVWVPNSEGANNMMHVGCVGILVGFKE